MASRKQLFRQYQKKRDFGSIYPPCVVGDLDIQRPIIRQKLHLQTFRIFLYKQPVIR